MRKRKRQPVRSAIIFLTLGAFASSYLVAQETNSSNGAAAAAPTAPAEPQQGGSNPSGGFRRVGDPPNTPPAANQSQNAQAQNAPYYAPGPAVQDNQAPAPAADPNQQTPNQPVEDGNQPPPVPPTQNGAQSYPGPETGGQNPYGRPPMSNQAPYGGQQGPPYGAQQGNGYGPPPSAPVPAQLTIKPGTFLTVRVNQPLSSDRNQVGDAFTATLVKPLVVDGVVVAEPGQTIAGRVAEAVKAGRVKGVSRLGLQLTELTLVDGQQVPLQSQLINRRGPTSIGRDVAGAGTTTALGAAVGAAVNGGVGAGVGAGAGLLVGVAGVLLTRGEPTIIVPEQQLTFRIEAPIAISTEHAAQAFHYIQPDEYASGPGYGYGPGPGYGQPPQYAAAAPYAYPYGYAYGYPYPYYGYYGYYPYWGPSFGFFYGGFYGRGFYGYGRGYGYGYGGYRGFAGGGFHGGRR